MRTFVALTAALIILASTAQAQSVDPKSTKQEGYKSGAKTSGESGMSSSRTAPTSPTAGAPGTVESGTPGKTPTDAGRQ